MIRGTLCPDCLDVIANNFYDNSGPEDHVCVTKADSDSVFAGLEALLNKWYPFSAYMAERRLAL